MDHEDSLGLWTMKIPQFWVPVDQSMLILGRMISATQGTSRPISAIFLFLKNSDNGDKDVAAPVLNDNNNLFSQKRKAVCCNIIFLKVRLQFTVESLINNFSLS